MREVLKKYWGYDDFRPLQEDIIQSILDGKDTLALLPTGGGKSICYQVPGMMKEGITIVVTPLLALMDDQVYHLKKKGIRAIAINSTLSAREVDIYLDNCVYGDYKFLYIAPERIQNELFWSRVEKMDVNLIAVDESHCVSQWGYDFRPSYFKIADLRTIKPDVPVLALTASATEQVQGDIIEKLQLKEVNVFKKSFAKENLQYVVEHCENKRGRVKEILSKVPGTALVYVRNRKKTKEISDLLNLAGIKSDYYHAGVSPVNRQQKQKAWIEGQIRVMVCTNAFGMGIDKADVRTVIHIDLPDSIEAYYQEAGRAGRDGKRAFAILLHEAEDEDNLLAVAQKQFPELSAVQRVYQALANNYQIGIGDRSEVGKNFELFKFCMKYNLEPSDTFHALKLLESEGWIQMSEAMYQPSRVQVLQSQEDLYAFQVANRGIAEILEALLRSYEGLMDRYVGINENLIANRMGISKDQLIDGLNQLSKYKVIHYIPQQEKPQIWFVKQRKDAKELRYSPFYGQRKQIQENNINSIIEYANQNESCRETFILNYFDEKGAKACGKCDWCLAKKKEVDIHEEVIRILTSNEQMSIDDLLKEVPLFSEKEMIQALRILIDQEKIERAEKLVWLKRK